MGEVLQSDKARVEFLRNIYPNAQAADWEKVVAGQRVQIIRPEQKGRGVLKLGTEIVRSADGTLSAVLGASPGASVSASIAIQLLEICAGQLGLQEKTQAALQKLIPSYGTDLANNREMCASVRKSTASILKLTA
ncbi:hypothetical protein AA106555_1601 [Neokomagataea thailandica NBRC 106555]|uniref:malate dehydrogenase (quinone) n=1 Tax=Neokomagataea thailandica NBRC 106555 TaxID=1223520 RepID=A0ABQ0QRF8_9PROT|nr:hypothetical protein AA106555_1601 [Neokomagataea thailandica NBRC 106555]